jgi:hypothetical protein
LNQVGAWKPLIVSALQWNARSMAWLRVRARSELLRMLDASFAEPGVTGIVAGYCALFHEEGQRQVHTTLHYTNYTLSLHYTHDTTRTTHSTRTATPQTV